MPTGTLPAEGKKLWEEVYDKALKGSCDGDKECAAGSAWKAVKNAGWHKVGDKWVKKAVLSEFSLRLERASYDKGSNQRRWRAVASDTDEDKRGDNMSLELFSDFIGRINSGELVPEEFRSDFWSGGLPYVSVSHYSDLNGEGVPGTVDSVYIDGKMLKAKGKFNDTVLGRKCFEAITEDLYGERKASYDKVRISIAFLDWMHKHKSNGFTFIRESIYDICPECLRELIEESDPDGKIFLRGHLIHLALTRVPANGRTNMEVDKSMGEIRTRKDDAASIVGEDEAEHLDKLQAEVGRSQVLVEFSETEPDEECAEDDEECKKKHEEMHKSEVMESEVVSETPASLGTVEIQLSSEISAFQSLLESINDRLVAIEKSMSQPVEPAPTPSPLDEPIGQLLHTFNDVSAQAIPSNEKLQLIQESYNALGEKIISLVQESNTTKEPEPSAPIEDTSRIDHLAAGLEALSQKFDLLIAKLSDPAPALPGPRVPERRSIQPTQQANPMMQQSLGTPSFGQPIKISDFARKSVGLD